MAANPRAGKPAQPEDLIDVAQVVTAYYTVEPDPDNIDQQVAFGTSGHRGSSLDAAFNEAHILATTQAIVGVPGGAGHHRPAVHRPRHPCAVRAGLGVGAGGAGRQRRCGDDRFGRPLHADAGGQPRDPVVQPRPRRRPGRRHRRHPVAQSAARRRIQVQPAQRRPGRHRRHRRDRQARQRDPARRAQGREAGAAGPGAADRAAPRLHGRLHRRPAERRRRARHPRREASASAPTRWAGRASTTGARSPNGTTST